jgi:hypothetical protein
MLETIWPLVVETERITALCTVLDRLCLRKDGRFLFYDGPAVPFAADFIVKAVERYSMPSLERAIAGAPSQSYAGGVAGELLDQAIQFLVSPPKASTQEQQTIRFRNGDAGIDLLLDGWSFAETWGTWSEGLQAGLRLPVGTKSGSWKAVITFQAFGKKGTVPVEITETLSSQKTEWRVPTNKVVQKELNVESRSADTLLRFAIPGATSPKALGMSDDRRCLGIGLISMDVIEPA